LHPAVCGMECFTLRGMSAFYKKKNLLVPPLPEERHRETDFIPFKGPGRRRGLGGDSYVPNFVVYAPPL